MIPIIAGGGPDAAALPHPALFVLVPDPESPGRTPLPCERCKALAAASDVAASRLCGTADRTSACRRCTALADRTNRAADRCCSSAAFGGRSDGSRRGGAVRG